MMMMMIISGEMGLSNTGQHGHWQIQGQIVIIVLDSIAIIFVIVIPIIFIIIIILIIITIIIMIMIRERRPSCFDITRPTYNLLLTPVSNELAEKLPEDLQELWWWSWYWWCYDIMMMILCSLQRRRIQTVALSQSFLTSWALASLMRWCHDDHHHHHLV